MCWENRIRILSLSPAGIDALSGKQNKDSKPFSCRHRCLISRVFFRNISFPGLFSKQLRPVADYLLRGSLPHTCCLVHFCHCLKQVFFTKLGSKPVLILSAVRRGLPRLCARSRQLRTTKNSRLLLCFALLATQKNTLWTLWVL